MWDMQHRGLAAYYQVWLCQSQCDKYVRYSGWYLIDNGSMVCKSIEIWNAGGLCAGLWQQQQVHRQGTQCSGIGMC